MKSQNVTFLKWKDRYFIQKSIRRKERQIFFILNDYTKFLYDVRG
jgi:hypothetical protein